MFNQRPELDITAEAPIYSQTAITAEMRAPKVKRPSKWLKNICDSLMKNVRQK